MLPRERYVSATCTLEMIGHIPEVLLTRILRQRIHLTESLPYINMTNRSNAESELDFLLGDEDKRQWQVTPPAKMTRANLAKQTCRSQGLLYEYCCDQLVK